MPLWRSHNGRILENLSQRPGDLKNHREIVKIQRIFASRRQRFSGFPPLRENPSDKRFVAFGLDLLISFRRALELDCGLRTTATSSSRKRTQSWDSRSENAPFWMNPTNLANAGSRPPFGAANPSLLIGLGFNLRARSTGYRLDLKSEGLVPPVVPL